MPAYVKLASARERDGQFTCSSVSLLVASVAANGIPQASKPGRQWPPGHVEACLVANSPTPQAGYTQRLEVAWPLGSAAVQTGHFPSIQVKVRAHSSVG